MVCNTVSFNSTTTVCFIVRCDVANCSPEHYLSCITSCVLQRTCTYYEDYNLHALVCCLLC